MTTWLDMANAVRGRWGTEVTTALSIPTQHDNFDIGPQTATWARLTLQPANSEQLELGAPGTRTFRTIGRFVASLFIPLNAGDATALSLADSISASFRAQTVAGVTYLTPTVSAVGRSGDWWQVNIDIPFTTEAQG